MSTVCLSQETKTIFKVQNTSKQNLIELDSVLFNHKYENLQTTDSIKALIFNEKENAIKLKPYEAYFNSEIEKSNSNFHLAIRHLDTANYLTQNPFLSAHFYKKKGQLYSVLGELSLSLKNLGKAMRIAEASNDEILIAEILVAKAEMFRKAKLFEEGLAALNMGLDLIEKNDPSNPLKISAYDRYAAILNESRPTPEGMPYSYMALSLAKQAGHLHSQAVSHNEIAYVHEQKINFDSAEYHYLKAISIWEQINAERYLCDGKTNLSRMYLSQGKLDKSKSMLFEIEENTKGRGWFELYPVMYEKIALIHLIEGDSMSYYKYCVKSAHAISELYRKENKQKMYELSFQYEQDANLRIIKNQKSEILLKESNIELKDSRTNLLGWFLSLVFILLILTLYFLRRNRMAKKNMSEVNIELNETLKEKDALIREVHHRVKNNFQMIYSLITLRAIDLKDEEAIAVLDETQSRILSMSLVHEQLYSGSNIDRVDLQKFLSDLIGYLAHSGFRSPEYFIVSETEIKLHIEQAIPVGIIIHEFVTNTLKYAWPNQEEKNILVEFENNGDHLSIMYSDNGIGLPEGFKIKDSSTFGLRLVDLFVHKQLKGKVSFDNNKPGAKFSITFSMR